MSTDLQQDDRYGVTWTYQAKGQTRMGQKAGWTLLVRQVTETGASPVLWRPYAIAPEGGAVAVKVGEPVAFDDAHRAAVELSSA